jgi:hypothetical protein
MVACSLEWIFDPLFFDPGVTAGSTKKLACAEARLNQLCEKIGLSALECARKNISIFCDGFETSICGAQGWRPRRVDTRPFDMKS